MRAAWRKENILNALFKNEIYSSDLYLKNIVD